MILKEILTQIEYIKFIGEPSLNVKGVVSLEEISGTENMLSWCNDKNIDKLSLVKTKSTIIVSEKVVINKSDYINYIIVENPRRVFQEVLTKFFSKKRSPVIHKSACISEDCIIGDGAFIGHNVIIEENCRIGVNVEILHNTTILKGTVIENNVTIGANNTIGGVGFGYEKNKKGDFELIPHIGNVVIKNNVDIGNNTCIDRAVMGSTIIGENVKIDNLVHIAHGVKVKRNSVVIANAMIAGSVTIGENSWIAPSASIINKKNIGSNALIGLGAVITKDVNDYEIVAGNPGKLIRKINKDE
ncbi:hypothetical protein [Pseudofulvibacter geojedonensis]|uniref:Mannose-1-phosphate guanyltransferase C-terminal domain-containing protein n=1 Tax=Pseudofulvibacter geojedonensis TaxID=1123758 RepID=A0ABW3I3Z1_9FLAO